MRRFRTINDVRLPELIHGEWLVIVSVWKIEGETVKQEKHWFDEFESAQSFYETEKIFIKKF